MHLLGNLLQHPVTGNLVRQIGNDYLSALANPAGAHAQRTAASFVHLPQVFARGNDFSTGREIRALDVFTQLVNGGIRLIQQADTGSCHFPHVVGRNVGRHTHGNAGSAVQQHMGQACRQYRRLFHGAVKVRRPVHGALPQLSQQHISEGRQAGFGITHGSKGLGIVRGTPVTLAVYQRIAVGKRLGHQHHGFITGAVTMGMELTQHVTHGTGGLFVLGGGLKAQLRHGIYNPALYRLEPVTHVGQCPVEDDVHGIVQIGLLGIIPEGDPLETFIRCLKLWHRCLFALTACFEMWLWC